MKQLLSIIVLIAVIAAVTCDHGSWGARQPYDRLLDSQMYSKSSKMLRIVTMDVNYKGYYNITMINAIDRSKGGTPTLLSGGPGSQFAVIHLKSKRGKALDYQLEIYGR